MAKKRQSYLNQSLCHVCREPYWPHVAQQFVCSTKCRRIYGTKELRRGRRIYALAYWWRLDRKGNKEDLRELCREIASWIIEDNEKGSKPPLRFDLNRSRGKVVL